MVVDYNLAGPYRRNRRKPGILGIILLIALAQLSVVGASLLVLRVLGGH